MSEQKFAPILICTHTRINHLARSIDSLKQSEIAKETVLYISSDAGKNASEDEIVKKIREYIRSIRGFKKVILIEREKNYGHFENFQKSTYEIFENHDSIIKLEDDIVVGKYYLHYMNEALNKYRDNLDVMTISGHLWPGFKIEGSTTGLMPLSNGWGWGTWKDRFNQVDHSNALAIEFLNSKALFFRMLLVNPGILGMVNAVAKGRLIAGDINWALHIIKYKKFVVFPSRSLVGNIGFDGSGQNCHLEHDDKFGNYSDVYIDVSSPPKLYSIYDQFKTFKKLGGFRIIFKSLVMYYVEIIFGYGSIAYLVKLKSRFR